MKKCIAIVLILTLLLLAGCRVEQIPGATHSGTTASAPVYTPPPEWDDTMTALLERTVMLSAADLEALNTACAQLSVTYPYEELYNLEDAYKRYAALPSYTSTHENDFSDGIFTADELYDIIKANNDAAGFQKNKAISDADLRYVCDIIAPLLLEYGKDMSEADAALLSEKVHDLSIYTYTGFSAGAYDSSTGQLGLDITQKKSDRFSRTVQHETHHLIQSGSLSENASRGFQNRYGLAYILDESDEQPLDFKWISEGSAELLTHNRLNSRDYDVYADIIQTINYIKVATVVRPDIGATDFERLSLSSDLDDLFAYFDCKTQQERDEILNMCVAVNYVADLHFCSSSFKSRCKDVYGQEPSASDLRMMVINSLGMTLSKEFFENLSLALQDQTVSVEDIFILNTLFEHRVCDYSLYRGAEPCREMLSCYKELQTHLFTALSLALGVTVDELYEVYDIYYVKAPITAECIPLLSTEEAEFLVYTTEATYNKRFRSINQYLIRL